MYGDCRDGIVSADSPACPTDDRGRTLQDIESSWLAADARTYVVRLSGLYGPQRVVGLKAIRCGMPIGGDPDNLLNLIHVQDAARLLLAIAQSDSAHRVELGSDGNPIRRIDYYAYLAHLTGQTCQFADGQSSSDSQRRSGSRTCDIEPTCSRTGWRPLFTELKSVLKGLTG